MSRLVRWRLPSAVVFAAIAVSACDDQIKRVPIFKTMSWQPSVEAFEETPRGAVAGTMPIDGERRYGLLEADTALVSPIVPDSAGLALGQERFEQFCMPCHGYEGRGDGPVVGPNRIPPIPTSCSSPPSLMSSRSELERDILPLLTSSSASSLLEATRFSKVAVPLPEPLPLPEPPLPVPLSSISMLSMK